MSTTVDVELDARFMRRALELAERGRGLTSPNPMVGAVIVSDEQIVGEGYHERAGGPTPRSSRWPPPVTAAAAPLST